MIQCSPQEIIAQSLRDCYRFEMPSQHLSRFTSPQKKSTNIYSPRRFQKKSLKKIPSLNQIQVNPSAQSCFNTQIEIKKVVKTQNEYQIRNKMSCDYNIIENKKYQPINNLEIERKPHIYISYKNPSIKNVKEFEKQNLPVYGDVFQLKQTFCASTEAGSHQASLFTSHLPEYSNFYQKSKQISNFNDYVAEPKQMKKIKSNGKQPMSPFRLFNPKMAVSQIENQQISQEQYSQVLQSYIKKENSE